MIKGLESKICKEFSKFQKYGCVEPGKEETDMIIIFKYIKGGVCSPSYSTRLPLQYQHCTIAVLASRAF